jgi:haloalkane dehalogenase
VAGAISTGEHAVTSGQKVSGERPFARKKYLEVLGSRMAFIDEGRGPAIVFQHGNPASSYLWRNVMPHLQGLGRLIAPDLIGFGDSDKLDPALGIDRYGFDQQRRYFDGLLDALDLGDDLVLVLHDLGSMLGFDWARRNSHRVRGIVYTEAIVAPLLITDFPAPVRKTLSDGFASPEGREASLASLDFLEGFLLGTRSFSETEQAQYRRPFLIPGEDRRPMISSELPVDGVPARTQEIVSAYSRWMGENDIPKLMIRAEPGFILTGRTYDIARAWRNQTEVTVAGGHFVQETSPDDVGTAIAEFVQGLRPSTSI